MLGIGATIRGKYEIQGIIGRGGMSTVYLARDVVTAQPYAIKDAERTGQDQNKNMVVQSLNTEGKMLLHLSNPHLPKIYDIIEESDSFMLVMDYVEGKSLDKVIAAEGAQDPENIYRWSKQICEVLGYLHSQNPPIVYRDMKPANVILQADGNIMVIDFGTARTQKNKAMSSDTVCIGTEGFAAPEQYGGNGQSDARTDVFCLGATIYSLATGYNPCDRPMGGIRSMREVAPQLEDSPLDYIIRKCTRGDPDERYQNMMEIWDDLTAAQEGNFHKKGRSSRLSARPGFEKQSVRGSHGNTAALSGLLKGRTAAPLPKKGTIPVGPGNWENPDAASFSWLTPDYSQPAEQDAPEPKTADAGPWHSVMLIAAAVAVVALVASILFVLLAGTVPAVIALCICVGATALAGLSAYFQWKQ